MSLCIRSATDFQRNLGRIFINIMYRVVISFIITYQFKNCSYGDTPGITKSTKSGDNFSINQSIYFYPMILNNPK